MGFTLQGITQVNNINGADCDVIAGSAPVFGTVNGGTLRLKAGNGSTSGGGGIGGNVIIAPGGGSSGSGSVVLSDAATTCSVVVNATAMTIAGSTKLVLDQKHIFVDNSNGTPSITAGGGTGATISGSDVAGQVTFGTGSPTSVTLNFANAYATAPIVIVTGTQSGQVLHVNTSTTQLQILSSSAFSSGTKVNYFVVGLQ